MQTLIAHSALWRGVAQFAGMLGAKVARSASTHLDITTVRGGELVCWCSTARSRREDELARSRQARARQDRPAAFDAGMLGQGSSTE